MFVNQDFGVLWWWY